MLRKFPAREIYLRSGGEVKFFTVSTKVQLLAAGATAATALSMTGALLVMGVNQASISLERAAIARQSASVATQAGRVQAYSHSVDQMADDLEARQDFLEETTKSLLGAAAVAGDVVGKAEAKTPDAKSPKGDKISAALPEARPLLKLEDRQFAFAQRLTAAVAKRTRAAEAAIRSFGLNPAIMARRNTAQGGPFIPWRGDQDAMGSQLKELSVALARLDMLESGLLAIPSGKPTATPMLSSSYGYRRDPFNGHAAFHSGLDFPGRYGQPILAAAAGRVTYVGQRQGYGNVVEVDHGHGLMTRYAHLSRFGARVGETVTRGEPIARMGSTGRSTGTHLHFEVRVNGDPINPRRFLEADRNVLQVQQIAKQRFADVGNRG